MPLGILGNKIGMTQIVDDLGNLVPVTILRAGPCTVTQIKTVETDGYSAAQLGYAQVTSKVLTKPQIGHLEKVGAPLLRYLHEYKISDTSELSLGQTIGVDIFSAGSVVDVTGKSIGKGFAGLQKRYNFGRGPMTHGSKNHRAPGSIGAGTTPGRVYPGKKMAGHLGAKQVTIKKLKVLIVDAENNLIIVKGAVPGKPGNLISIQPYTFSN
ncbi:50S ribosomal protein L3 (chloroplast) [Aureococcus anophagefferens]|jgi:large subunit ribosomal protein L3|uniref:Large ribosomal subunit protein uL3c n=2 Tax=Aureococcus anophagefferens TaxID=44056 RepID=C6KIK5_AURAN|nr:50S ribosomal protein L3 [Aureococcus anophagefferens]ACS36811.1 50S ribosomal protein L3 [Aureococcus anophagefferens]KAH8042982.1 50S ribosomal protein L3 [Aureococcus anophagefferens]KAH8043081.1 50S ribosomal protein L3 [Aureococcus anophagefferens]KAH8043284.1 50S ribosomal protein L3 [Aureococcus anophagefferens]|tara:strand:+ start:500 stop:1132 length:633 start_codon:yes stop_codon:yes gene_type:complete